MPDIGDLLNTAAHDPRTPLDLATVERRAGALRRRQQALLAAPALVLVLVVSALVLTRGPGTPDELREADGGTVTADPGASALTDAVGSPGAPGSSTTPVPDIDGRPAGDVAEVSGEPRPATSAPRGSLTQPPVPTPTSYPRAPSCRVSTVGMPAGQSRSCSFTATADGGYRLNAAHPGNFVAGEHRVDVTRDGKTTTYGKDFRDSCGDSVIEPGDRVVVTVRRTSGNVTEFEMAAGEGYNCGAP